MEEDAGPIARATDARKALARCLKAHEVCFDTEKDCSFEGRKFDGYAEFHASSSQYVLVKRAKLWEVDSHEYIFFKAVERLDASALADLIEFMKTKAVKKVVPEEGHMTSYLTLVIVACSIEEEVPKLVAKTRFRKNFRFGLRGWADLRVCVVCLEDGEVLANGQAKEMVETLKANAFMA